MMYQIMTSAHGLTKQQALLNMQRNILEEGPIYTTFDVAQDFFDFFSAKGAGLNGDVLATAGGASHGGHAVVLTGWGTTTASQPLGVGADKPYWWLRNSWTNQWGMGGYGKVLAGADLMGLETRAAVAMADPNYEDFSPPTCLAQGWSTGFKSYPGGELCYYSMDLQIKCTEDATIKVLYGKASAKAASATTEQQAAYKIEPLRCVGGITCVVNGIDLLYAGYGLADYSMYVKIDAWDDKQNYYSTHASLDMSALKGMTKVGGQKACGAPSVTCSGCAAGTPWPEPARHTPPAPAPPWKAVDYSITLPPGADSPAESEGTSRRRTLLYSSPQGSPEERIKGSSGAPSSFSCFPPDSTVRLSSGLEAAAGALVAGDVLLGRDGVATPYLLDFHEGMPGMAAATVSYLEVEHALQRIGRPLVISAGHMVYSGKNGFFVPATALKVGDELQVLKDGAEQVSVVLAVRRVERVGYAAPLAEAGELWVEDVLVSSYALFSDAQLSLWHKGPAALRERAQIICHALAAPFRALAALRRVFSAAASSATVSAPVQSFMTDGYLRLIGGLFDGILGAQSFA